MKGNNGKVNSDAAARSRQCWKIKMWIRHIHEGISHQCQTLDEDDASATLSNRACSFLFGIRWNSERNHRSTSNGGSSWWTTTNNQPEKSRGFHFAQKLFYFAFFSFFLLLRLFFPSLVDIAFANSLLAQCTRSAATAYSSELFVGFRIAFKLCIKCMRIIVLFPFAPFAEC